MKGHLTQEIPAPAPAAAVWEAYRGIELGRLVSELLGDVIGTAEVVEGTLTGGYMKEIFSKMDDENRVEETQIIEGGERSLGLDSYRIKLEILEIDDRSSTIRSSIVHEILDETKNDLASHASMEPFEIIAKTVGKYLAEKK